MWLSKSNQATRKEVQRSQPKKKDREKKASQKKWKQTRTQCLISN